MSLERLLYSSLIQYSFDYPSCKKHINFISVMLQTAALEKQVEFQKARLESLQLQRDSALEAAEQVNQSVKKEVPLAFLCRVVWPYMLLQRGRLEFVWLFKISMCITLFSVLNKLQWYHQIDHIALLNCHEPEMLSVSDQKLDIYIIEFSLTSVLGAHGPLLGRQEERWAEIVAERAELQQAVNAAGAGSLVQDLITLLDQSMVCQKYIYMCVYFLLAVFDN